MKLAEAYRLRTEEAYRLKAKFDCLAEKYAEVALENKEFTSKIQTLYRQIERLEKQHAEDERRFDILKSARDFWFKKYHDRVREQEFEKNLKAIFSEEGGI